MFPGQQTTGRGKIGPAEFRQLEANNNASSIGGYVAAVLAVSITSQTASACHTCRQNPCVLAAPQPAYECVTEMVPYTVMKNHWRTEYETVTKTVMVRQPITNYVERQRVVCKPVYDTIEVPRQRVVCKPIHETDYVTQTYTVCKPVQTTQQVTSYCYAADDPACHRANRA